MKIPLMLKVTVPIIIALLLALAWSRADARKWRRVADQEALRGDSTAAANDTTRRIAAENAMDNLGLKMLLSDTAVIYQRRIVQLEGRMARVRDTLATVLGIHAAAVTAFTARIRTLETMSTSPGPVTVSPVDSAREATFQVDSVPWHVNAAVSLPAPPARGSINLKVGIDPAAISILVACGQSTSPTGIRPATANLTVPEWLTVDVRRVEQSAGVCNPEMESRARTSQMRLGIGTFLGICAAAPLHGVSPQFGETTAALCLGGGITFGKR